MTEKIVAANPFHMLSLPPVALLPRLRYKVIDMAAASRPLLTALALLVVAPIGAAVIISVLLLFGVTPHLVFLPGFAVRTKLAALGFHAPNAVGVVVTLIVWLAARRVRRRPA